MHLYGELIKTKSGINLIKEKGHLDKLIKALQDKDSPTLEKRIALWAIGNIGKSKNGI